MKLRRNILSIAQYFHIDPLDVHKWEYCYFLEVVEDVNRFVEEKNARQNDKDPAPELNEDGTYFDSELQEAHSLTDEDVLKELEQPF